MSNTTRAGRDERTPDETGSEDRRKGVWLYAKVALFTVTMLTGAGLIVSNLAASGRGDRMAGIFDAVARGDVAAVRSAAKRGGELLEVDLDGNTPLHRAVRADQLAVAAVLIEAGAPVHAKNAGGYTPLDLAVLTRDWDTTGAVRLLLDAGAKVDTRLPTGEPLLHTAIAARRDDDPVVQLLLSRASRPALEARNSRGQTALDVALQAGNTRTAERIRGTVALQ